MRFRRNLISLGSHQQGIDAVSLKPSISFQWCLRLSDEINLFQCSSWLILETRHAVKHDCSYWLILICSYQVEVVSIRVFWQRLQSSSPKLIHGQLQDLRFSRMIRW